MAVNITRYQPNSRSNGPAAGRVARKADHRLDVVDVGALVGDLGLDAERTEIVADEQGRIVAVIVVESELRGAAARNGRREAEVEVDVFDDHPTEIATDVPGVIAREGRRGEYG